MSVRNQEEVVAQGSSAQFQPDVDEKWRPIIIGNLSRWSEIRRKNRLVDEMSYEAQHLNLATLDDMRKEIIEIKLVALRRNGSRRGGRSLLSHESSAQAVDEQDNGDPGVRR